MTKAVRASPLCIFLLLLAVLLGIAALRPIDHDEGQYVAAVALMRSGLPYRDFAYLQTPLQPLLFAPLARLCEGWLFLALRAVNALCAAGAAALLYRAVCSVGGTPRSAGIVAMALVTSHAFLFAATVARNDALPLLLHMAGLALLIDALGTARRPPFFMLAGLLLGAAASAKISYGLPAASIGLFALVNIRRLGPMSVLALAAGGIAGGLPTLILWAIAPDAAWFGIIDYSLKAPLEWQMLNQRAYMVEAPLSALRLLRFLAQGSALLALVAMGVAILRRSVKSSITTGLLDYVIVAGLIAAWLPRPIYAQYLVPLLPALFLRFGLMLDAPFWHRPAAIKVLALCMMAGAADTLIRITPNIASGHSPILSATRDAHAIGQSVRASAIADPIVSLAPERVVDSGIPLDPRFAAGPFLFRTRDLLTRAEQHAFHVLNGASVAEGLTRYPPAAIVTGLESAPSPASPQGLDSSLIAWAVAHGYRPTSPPLGEGTLYLRQE
ncbi:hypothetical protein KRZ98_11735 [Sphingobium sp. AS12]|uniref:hypothetical protein n=1 Tax=Sphingobium sp. AS12 TaxID=2849495 RepID=UPI001C319A12|nr:hypothetical protein [Sphingobium sp. AS12]MBV2148957.1 hypothetical protein [Sphingobium sp. AS12]